MRFSITGQVFWQAIKRQFRHIVFSRISEGKEKDQSAPAIKSLRESLDKMKMKNYSS
jgi:hypothetical protein